MVLFVDGEAKSDSTFLGENLLNKETIKTRFYFL